MTVLSEFADLLGMLCLCDEKPSKKGFDMPVL
jgi:hypothetical protein